MLKPISTIIKDSIGNITYRGNVVTGTVAVVRGDGSYDVFISESEKAYPKIFTLSANPDLAVGDKVRILYKNGCKELPIILPPTTVVSNFIFVVYQSGGSFYLNRYTYNGVLNAELGILSEIAAGNPYKMCVDSNQNIYIFNYAYPNMTIYKYDKNGNHLLTKALPALTHFVYISPNGYLYTLVYLSNTITERNLSDLEINSTYTLTSGNRFYYITFDSDGYFYTYNWDSLSSAKWGYEKWEYNIGRIAVHLQTNNASSYDSWVVAGDYIGCSYSTPYTITKALNANRVSWTLNEITTLYRMASISGYFICLGRDVSGKLIMEKYTPERVRQWKTEVATSFTANLQYCGIAAYPF